MKIGKRTAKTFENEGSSRLDTKIEVMSLPLDFAIKGE